MVRSPHPWRGRSIEGWARRVGSNPNGLIVVREDAVEVVDSYIRVHGRRIHSRVSFSWLRSFSNVRGSGGGRVERWQRAASEPR